MSNQKSQPVLIAASVLTAAQAFLTAAGISDILTKEQLTLGTALVGAATLGIGFYVRGQVVPLEDTAAYKDKTGEIVTGPAAPPEGEPAAVVTDEDLTPTEAYDPEVEGP